MIVGDGHRRDDDDDNDADNDGGDDGDDDNDGDDYFSYSRFTPCHRIQNQQRNDDDDTVSLDNFSAVVVYIVIYSKQ